MKQARTKLTAKKDSVGNQFFGWATISSKGQLAIPVDIRQQLGVTTGDRFLIVVRKDQDGINLIQANALNKVFKKFSQ